VVTLFTRHPLPSNRHRYTAWGEDTDRRALPHEFHLVYVAPGCTSTVYRVDPDRAGFLAAAREGRDAVIAAILEATRYRASTPLTPEQARVLDGLVLSQESAMGVWEAMVGAVVKAGT